MPNWCSNKIEITGTKEQIALLTKVLEDVPKSKPQECIVFESLIGREPDMSKDEYEQGGWYQSNIGWFGTKWDVSYDDCNFNFEEECITMYPDTAWSPPIGFGARLHEMYGVDVELYYEEPGCDFCGRTTIDKEGVMDEEDYSYLEGKYHFDNESFWYEIENDIEYYKDDNDGKTIEEFVEERYSSFVSEKDKEEILKLFKDSINEKQS